MLSPASTTQQQPSYDINYLKRLLFLKAAIDQEQTYEIFGAPITQQEFNLAHQNHVTNANNTRTIHSKVHTSGADLASDAQKSPKSHVPNAIGSEGGAASTHMGLEPRFNDTFSAPFINGSIRPTSKDDKLLKRRTIQKSIDLQDYLNYTTGLDYKKLPSATNPQPSHRSKPQPPKEKTSLIDKINKNRFITDNDFEN